MPGRRTTVHAEQMAAPFSALTPREMQVATLLGYGYTNRAIAEQLSISIRTVDMHRANVLRKVGAETRADVVRWALDHDLLH
jgi:DNA-binding NarL/FixJ family response regulator